MRKRQPAKSVGAAAQYASARAPGRGRSQFRRESRARRNPREAGPEPRERACLPEGVDLRWRVCSSANWHVTDDGGRLEPRLCASQTFRQKSELSPGHENSREAGSRDNGVWGRGRAAWRVYADAQPPSQATPTQAFSPAPSASLGRRGSGCVGGALAPGLAPPPRPPIGQARASSHAACLLARACRRRAPLVCSDLGTKFKDFKSTSWRLLRATARRSGWPSLSCGRRHLTCIGA